MKSDSKHERNSAMWGNSPVLEGKEDNLSGYKETESST